MSGGQRVADGFAGPRTVVYCSTEAAMRLLTLAVLLAPLVPGQNFRGQIRIKPLVPPLSQPWNATRPLVGVRPAPEIRLMNPAAVSRPCSVPLLQVTPRELDAKIHVAPPSAGARMPVVEPPAPPCVQDPRK